MFNKFEAISCEIACVTRLCNLPPIWHHSHPCTKSAHDIMRLISHRGDDTSKCQYQYVCNRKRHNALSVCLNCGALCLHRFEFASIDIFIRNQASRYPSLSVCVCVYACVCVRSKHMRSVCVNITHAHIMLHAFRMLSQTQTELQNSYTIVPHSVRLHVHSQARIRMHIFFERTYLHYCRRCRC